MTSSSQQLQFAPPPGASTLTRALFLLAALLIGVSASFAPFIAVRQVAELTALGGVFAMAAGLYHVYFDHGSAP